MRIAQRNALVPGPIPLYYQLQVHLAGRIRSGEFQPAAALPTEEQLCTQYGVSRITVRRALDRLTADRLIERRRGVGTFVAEAHVPVEVELVGSLDDVVSSARDLSHKVISKTAVGPDAFVAGALRVASDSRVVKLETVHYSGGDPFAYVQFFFPEAVGSLLDPADIIGERPILRVVEDQLGEGISRAVQTVEPGFVGAHAAQHLGIKARTPALLIRRVYYTEADLPVEVAVARYHPERYHYTVQLFARPRGLA
jgi:GntR family transcriptional regulator